MAGTYTAETVIEGGVLTIGVVFDAPVTFDSLPVVTLADVNSNVILGPVAATDNSFDRARERKNLTVPLLGVPPGTYTATVTAAVDGEPITGSVFVTITAASFENQLSDSDAQITARISNLCDATYYPKLNDADLAELLLKAKRADGFGRGIREPEWVPTYNLNAAVIAGWRLKARRAAATYDFSDSDQSLKRSQVYEMCLKQASEYLKSENGSVVIYAPQRNDVVIPSILTGLTVMPTAAEQVNT